MHNLGLLEDEHGDANKTGTGERCDMLCDDLPATSYAPPACRTSCTTMIVGLMDQLVQDEDVISMKVDLHEIDLMEIYFMKIYFMRSISWRSTFMEIYLMEIDFMNLYNFRV